MTAKKQSRNRACTVCGGDIKGRSPLATICGAKKCVRERNRLKAALHGRRKLWGQPKACGACGKTYKRSKKRKKFCSDPCAKEGTRMAAAAREREALS